MPSPAVPQGAGASGRRRLGIGHLTMLDVSPPELVGAAAAAGFDFVGFRVCAGGPGEQLWPLAPGSPMLRETLRRLDDTGLTVNEIDVIPLRSTTTLADVAPALATAAALGAGYAITFIEDDDLDRAGDTLALLAPAAAEHGLRILIEPMAYKQVRSFAQALRLIDRAPGCGIMIDPLQLHRGGDTLDAVRALDPALVPVMQLCDGPLQQPEFLTCPGPLPRGQAPGTSVGQLEARAWRRPVGEGDLPLAELVNILPGVPISIEAPNLGLSRLLDPVELAHRHMTGLARVVAATDRPAAAHRTAG